MEYGTNQDAEEQRSEDKVRKSSVHVITICEPVQAAARATGRSFQTL
jgi:hypothetical protein